MTSLEMAVQIIKNLSYFEISDTEKVTEEQLINCAKKLLSLYPHLKLRKVKI